MSSTASAGDDRDTETDEVLESAKPLVIGIQATLGKMCEVVLHDFREKDHSIVAIAGDVTHRGIGSPMSEIGLALSRAGDEAEDRLNYLTRLSDGRIMKSSTMLLRTPAGRVVGALCINLDVTQIRMLTSLMSDMSGEGPQPESEPVPITFASNVDAVIESVLVDIESQLGRPLTHLSTEDWLRVFRLLDGRGIFQIRRAVPLLSRRLGLSRATVYNYVNRLRDAENSGS
jgi:predicted transcriptional regulator YheO